MQVIYIINKFIYIINIMDKTIYTYLAIFVVLYGLYRLNSNEHFSDNTTVYIKSKYNLEEDSKQIKEAKKRQEEEEEKERKFIEDKMKAMEKKKFEIKQNQIRQYELGKEQIIKAQNYEMILKNNHLEAKLEETKSELVKTQEQMKQQAIDDNAKEVLQSAILVQERYEKQKELEEQKKQIELEKIELNKKGFISELNDKVKVNIKNVISNI